jgi:hypothetical protein
MICAEDELGLGLAIRIMILDDSIVTGTKAQRYLK